MRRKGIRIILDDPLKGKYMVNPKQKGKKGEDEACRWLSENLYKNRFMLERIHNQTFFGADAFSHPFIWEFKRQETLTLDKFWIQISTVRDKFKKRGKNYIPVCMFRQNRRAWEFLISAETIGNENGYVRLNSQTFLSWAKRYI